MRWMRNKWLRRGMTLLSVIVIVAGVRAWQQRDLAGGPAPQLVGTSVTGKTLNMTGASAPALVYFWATWCPACRLTRATVESLAVDYPVVTVALASGTDAELMQYMKQHGVVAPTLNDPDGEHAAQWGVRGTPTFFVIDRQGQIRFREVGYTSEWGLRLRLWLAS